MLLIVVNTIILSLDRFPLIDPKSEKILSDLNIVFTSMFTLEAILKIVGLGIKEFASDRFNIFDALVVVISLVTFILC